MDFYDKSLSQHCRKGPSFSSSLLNAIYRSIDEGDDDDEEAEVVFYRETMRKKQGIERTEKRTKETAELRRRQSDSQDGLRRSLRNQDPILLSSTSSSSESSYSGFGFSSSEAESVRSRRPKPLQSLPSKPQISEIQANSVPKEKSKWDGFVKTKASKLYGDLKKAGQPVSPGGRIASFLNALFASNAKKAKIDDSKFDRKIDSSASTTTTPTPTCSSASSYSRSCLSKTPSSRGNSTNGVKRSVRFYPVPVIVDGDCRPCGQKNIYDVDRRRAVARDELKLHLMERSKRIEEAAKDLLKEYQKKSDFLGEVMRTMHQDQVHDDDDEEDDDDNDDGYSSSDLFELEIGIGRYREELPVYETTRLDKNRAIGSGLIL